MDQSKVARELRDIAANLTDEEHVTLVQSVADYIESTADYTGRTIGSGAVARISPRELYAEIAMAYVEGYEHATGTTAREAARAIRAVGLSI